MQPARPLRVALLEDVELVTLGLASMVEPYADRVEVVVRPDSDEPRDITLVDVRHEPGGTAEITAARERNHPGRVVVWSWDLDPRLVQQSLEQGAAGYLAKWLPATELVTALERIHAGETVVTAGTADPHPGADATGTDATDATGSSTDAAGPGAVTWPGREAGLTARESEVVRLITAGLSNQQIADRAYLSINSVKSYIRSSYRKMGVTSRSRAVLWGVEHDMHGQQAERGENR